MSSTKANGLRAVAPATEAKVVHISRGTAPDSASELLNAIQRPDPDNYPLGVVWQREHRSEMIQFSISEHNGSRFADLRRYYRRGEEWLPGPKGCTMPLCGLQGLFEAIGQYLAANDSQGTQNAA